MITNKCGIYKIINTVTGDFYIGSAGNLRKRFNQHRSELVNGRHINAHLQNAWNRYGEPVFEFLILEYCEIEQAIKREQFYIDTEKPSYNICKIAGSSLGRIFSDESRAKMSEAHKGKVLTEDQKRKIREANKGALNPNFGKPMSEEQKRKLSEVQRGELSHNFGRHLSEETKQKLSKIAIQRQSRVAGS